MPMTKLAAAAAPDKDKAPASDGGTAPPKRRGVETLKTIGAAGAGFLGGGITGLGVNTAAGHGAIGLMRDGNARANLVRYGQAMGLKGKTTLVKMPHGGNFAIGQKITGLYGTTLRDMLHHHIGAMSPEEIESMEQAMREGHNIVGMSGDVYADAHELGHVTGLGQHLPWQLTHGLSRAALIRLLPLYGLGASAVGASLAHKAPEDMTPSERRKERLAKYGPVAVAAPMLTEEARASLRALNAIRRTEGWGKALRGVPRLGLALGSYGTAAAIPSLQYHMARRARQAMDRQPLGDEGQAR